MRHPSPPQFDLASDVADLPRTSHTSRSELQPADRAAEAVQIGTWEWRLAAGRMAWSPQTDAILGLTAGSFSGTFDDFLQLIHEADRAPLQLAIQTAIQNRQPCHLEHRIVTPAGTIRWVSCRGRAVMDPDGAVTGMAGTIEDITRRKETDRALRDLQDTLEQRVQERTASLEEAVRELQDEIARRRQADAALKNSEQRYQTLYEHNPSMYFTLAPDGTILSVNRFGAEELGYTSEELAGQSVLKVFRPADHQTVSGQLRLCSQSPERTFDWEIQKIRKNGELLWVKERARAITGHDGRPIILIVCEDITARRQTEGIIRDREERLLTTTQFLHTLVRESPLPIVSLDAEARVTSWNQAATALFGWTETEVLGNELPYVPPGEAAEADALWAQSTRNLLRGPVTLRRQCKSGAMVDLLLWPMFVHNENAALTTAIGLYVDRSDLQRTEAARLHSEERLRAFLNALDDLAFELDEQGTYLNVWTRNEDRLPLPKQDILGKTLIDLYGREAGERYRRILTRVLHSGQPETIEYALTLHGQLRHFSAILSRIPANTGTPSTVACIVRDITDRKQAEGALRESEERWQHFVANAPVGLVMVDAGKRILSANAAFCRLTGYSAEEVIGNTCARYTHPDDLPKNLQLAEEFFAGKRQEYTFEQRYVRKNGEIIWVSIRTSRLTVHGSAVPLLLAVVEDITDRTQALADRERISQDLHDNILQSLYTVGMQLEAGKLLAGKAPRKSKQHITQAVRQLNRLVLEVWQFITGLTRRTAPTLDFSVALNQLVASCSSETRTAPELDLDPTALTVVTPAIGEQLLSIAREALSNSVRHAGATHRSVGLTKTDSSIRLRVADDGKGFDPGRTRRRGHGLANMAARARTIGGQFTLDSAPGRGTSITIDVPTKDPHAG